MAELMSITSVRVGADKLRARVVVNPGMPLSTAEDIEATARVYYLAPAIAKHLCLGDTGREFQECMGDTELPHLLEHLTVEILNETGLAGKVSCGRTRQVPGDERLFDVELSCPDDALTVGALSSATFMMDWAFLHPQTPAPDFEGTVGALRKLALNLRGEDVEDEDEQEGEVDAEAEVSDGLPAEEPEEPPVEEPAEPEPEVERPHPRMADTAQAKRVADVFH